MTKQTPLQKYFAELYSIVKAGQRPHNTYYLDGTVSAKIIRLTLAEKFPATKFQIKTRKYAGGCSIDIDWTDGPNTAAIEAAIMNLEGSSFDGMNDLKTNNRHTITPEGIFKGGVIREGEFEVGMMADYIFPNRHNSDKAVTAALAQLATEYGHIYSLATWNNGGVFDNEDRRAIRGYLEA
jgi:hypothetical protein